ASSWVWAEGMSRGWSPDVKVGNERQTGANARPEFRAWHRVLGRSRSPTLRSGARFGRGYESDGISNPFRYSRVSSLSAALSFSNVSVLPLKVRPCPTRYEMFAKCGSGGGGCPP